MISLVQILVQNGTKSRFICENVTLFLREKKKAEALKIQGFPLYYNRYRGSGTNRVRKCRKMSHKSSIYGIFSCFGTIFGTISRKYIYIIHIFDHKKRPTCPGVDLPLKGETMTKLSEFFLI